MGNGQTYKAIQCKGREAFDKDAALKLLERLGAASEDMAPLVRRGNPYKQWKLVGKTEKPTAEQSVRGGGIVEDQTEKGE